MKENNFLDLCKFLLSLTVVAIHTGLCIPVGKYNILYPWLRIAVPMFFLMSSYFFFVRYDLAVDKMLVLRKWLVRNGSLYLFWFVALLPVTLFIRHKSWLGNSVILNVKNFIMSVLFGSTFVASWFITALVISVIIVLAVSKYMGKVGVMIVGLMGYVWSVLDSSYGGLSGHLVSYNSFPAAIIWAAMGFAFARGWKIQYAIASVVSLFSAILLWAEWIWRANVTGYQKFDCYFALFPLTVAVFSLVKEIDLQVKFARTLRRLSVVVFCLHGSVVMFARGFVCKVCGFSDVYHIGSFLVTSIFCVCIYAIVYFLSQKDQFAFMKYSY